MPEVKRTTAETRARGGWAKPTAPPPPAAEVAGRRRTIAERDREAAIRGYLLGRHDVEAREVRVCRVAGEWAIDVHLDRYHYTAARASEPGPARAVAYALSVVLKCPVDTEAVDG